MLALLAFLLGNTKNILIIAVGVAFCLTRDGRGMNANFLCDTFFLSVCFVNPNKLRTFAPNLVV